MTQARNYQSVFRPFLLILYFAFVIINAASAQHTDKHTKFDLKGYVKYLQSSYIFNESNPFKIITGEKFVTDNLIHNLLNFRIYPSESFTIAVDIRNRIHFGEYVKTINDLSDSLSKLPPIIQSQLPASVLRGFGEQLDSGNDIYDMSVLIFNKRSAVWHAMIDRLYINWVKGDFELRAGRQRINWGLTLVWNPNDIFNTYSFFDFDYEERPGSDAIRLTYYTGIASSVELAVKAATTIEELVAALLYRWNVGSYDLQVLGGVANEDMVLGGGWAGNIKNAGFKGEFTYFHPYDHPLDSTGVFSGTIAFDYSFKNSLFLNTGFLYMSNGETKANLFYSSQTEFTSKTLSPYKYSFFAQISYSFTPIFTGSLAAIYYPGADQALFIGPGLTYSIKENWDIDVIGQLFTSKESDSYKFLNEVIFFRLKWSY